MAYDLPLESLPAALLFTFCITTYNQNYNKILERDWLSTARFEH